MGLCLNLFVVMLRLCMVSKHQAHGRFLFGYGFGCIGFAGDRTHHLLDRQRTDLIAMSGEGNTTMFRLREILCPIINCARKA